MPHYRKKPVVVEAWPFDGSFESYAEVAKHVASMTGDDRHAPHGWRWFAEALGGRPACMEIATLEGVMTAMPGDMIIRGVKGEFYPCKPDIFAATYELIV